MKPDFRKRVEKTLAVLKLKRITNLFITQDGGKRVVRTRRVLGAFAASTLLGIALTLCINPPLDTSYLGRTDRTMAPSEKPARKDEPSESETVGKMLKNSESKDAGKPQTPASSGIKLNYKAQQVLVREGADPARTMPTGTNLIGTTLNAIDTRDASQFVKVLLPYGGSSKNGGELPKNSVLQGEFSYGGKGNKVFVKLNKGVLPSGKEIKVDAQVLDPNNYSPGLEGRYHGNADMRIASSLGLTLVAGISDVLTEKESLGGGGLLPGGITPKSNLKNAVYHGVSQVAETEATRQAEALGQEQAYVTVDAGSDLIVSLTNAFVAE